MKILKSVLVIFSIGIYTLNINAQSPDDLIGYWLSEEKDGQIQIYKKNGKYFGKLIWIEEPNEKDGSPKLDDKNPDEKLRNRKVQGLEILKDFSFDKKEDEWSGGTIYDPESGKTYKAFMWFENGNTNLLQLRGYFGFSLLGRTTEWTREKAQWKH